jgi:hypothetical protein
LQRQAGLNNKTKLSRGRGDAVGRRWRDTSSEAGFTDTGEEMGNAEGRRKERSRKIWTRIKLDIISFLDRTFPVVDLLFSATC